MYAGLWQIKQAPGIMQGKPRAVCVSTSALSIIIHLMFSLFLFLFLLIKNILWEPQPLMAARPQWQSIYVCTGCL